MQNIVQIMEVNYSALVKIFADFALCIQFQKPEIPDFNFVFSGCIIFNWHYISNEKKLFFYSLHEVLSINVDMKWIVCFFN